MASFGARLRRLRDDNKISREELAKALKLSYWAIAKYETEERTPDPSILQRFADYFNTTTDYLLGRTDDPRPPEKRTLFDHEQVADKVSKYGEEEKEEAEAKALLDRTHPQMVDLLYRVKDLTEDEKESLMEHWEWAMKVIEKERERRRRLEEKFKDKE